MSFLTKHRLLPRILGGLALFVFGATLLACHLDDSDGSEIDPSLSLREQLQIVADRAVESGLPGVSLHVQTRRESISVVAGVANRESAQPVRPDSLFHAASSGKTLVATMMLRLIQAGQVGLEDSITRWLDPAMASMIKDADKITVKMLMANTSGIPDYFNESNYMEAFAQARGQRWTPTELLDFIHDMELHFAPGTQYRYSNTNFLLLGVIAQRVTGKPFEQALRSWVMEPAGLEHTFGVFERLGQPASVRSYVPDNAFDENSHEPAQGPDFDTSDWLNVVGHGDAPIHSTPRDLNAFLRRLVDTDTLVSGDLKRMMLTESIPGVSHYGLGISIENEGRSFEHSGRSFGVLSWMFYAPSMGASFTTMSNGSFGAHDTRFTDHAELLQRVVDRHMRRQEQASSQNHVHAAQQASLPATSTADCGGRFGARHFHW